MEYESGLRHYIWSNSVVVRHEPQHIHNVECKYFLDFKIEMDSFVVVCCSGTLELISTCALIAGKYKIFQ